MRRPGMAGNWKMFKTAGETRASIEKFKPLVARATHCDIVLCPPFTSLAAAAEAAPRSDPPRRGGAGPLSGGWGGRKGGGAGAGGPRAGPRPPVRRRLQRVDRRAVL